MIFTGEMGEWRWLASDQLYMGDFVRICPDVVIGRSLVVVVRDSSVPELTESQVAAGWELRGGMAYSRGPVRDLGELFFQRDGPDCPGFDEWLLFNGDVPPLGEVHRGNPFEPGNEPGPGRVIWSVGIPGFRLDAGGDAVPAEEWLWKKMDWIQPDLYVGDDYDHLALICKEQALFASVLERLSDGDSVRQQSNGGG